MLFNSFNFFIFFPVVTVLYFALPFRFRSIWLLIVSCYFYMVFVPYYIFILLFTIIIDYVAGILIEKNPDKKKWLLISSIVANLGVLCFFKYYNFFNGNLIELSRVFGWNYGVTALKIILPIGLSFHTFQAMSYTIEVYRGNQRSERNFIVYALYVMYYPQLVAGPIERPQNILPQLHKKHDFDYDRIVSGFKWILWGLFKKMVIADNLALYVNQVYDTPETHFGISLLIATVFFAFQIYCDFSGYSDIAIGASRVMGIELMKNFNRPYASQSISEFWKRWHISLSTWFRDYLYIPLGGNRVKIHRLYFNLFFVFLISGLWHGANWTFVIWGAIHGLYLISGIILKDFNRYVFKNSIVLNTFITFSLVCFAWIFFRANSLTHSLIIVKKILTEVPSNLLQIISKPSARLEMIYLNGERWDFVTLIILILLLECLQYYFLRGKNIITEVVKSNIAIRWCGYLALFIFILFWGRFGSTSFIYFQF